MSWSDIFPVLTEEMVEEFEAKVTPDERAQYEEWLGVERAGDEETLGVAVPGCGGGESLLGGRASMCRKPGRAGVEEILLTLRLS